MHVKLQTCASFQFNSLIIVVWVNCMNKLSLLTTIKVNILLSLQMFCAFLEDEDHLRIQSLT